MDRPSRLTRLLAGAATLSLLALTACAAAPAPKKISGAYDAQDAALRAGANLTTSVARAVNDMTDARGATAVVLGNVALVATDLRPTTAVNLPAAGQRTPETVTSSLTGSPGTPSTITELPNTPSGGGGASTPGKGSVSAPPSRDRIGNAAARPGGGTSPGVAIPGGTPNETGQIPGGGVLGNSGQPSGPPASNATGQQERFTRLAQGLQADYPQLAEVRFITNRAHALRLAAIVDSLRQGTSISRYLGELAAIAADSVPAGLTRIPGGRPQPGGGAPGSR